MSYALITGAAKGIGRAIATELARRDYQLLLIDLDKSGLEKTAETLSSTYQSEVHTLHIDLSAPDALQKILHWTRPFHGYLRLVVNNAGYGLNAPFEQLTLEEQLNIIDVNIKAQVSISHAYLPVLKAHKKAYLLNVGSTTAYQTVPYLNIYAASKAFVVSFTRGLRYELRNSSVSVSCLSPGSTDTDFVNRAGMGESVKQIANRLNMTPEAVASIALKGLFKGEAEIIPGITNKLNAFLPKFFPKRFVESIAANIYQPAKKEQQQTTEYLHPVTI